MEQQFGQQTKKNADALNLFIAPEHSTMFIVQIVCLFI